MTQGDFLEQRDEHIEFIIENFNFPRVRQVMKALDWRWFGIKGVPSIENLKYEARILLQKAAKDQNCWSTGGFSASYIPDGERGSYLMLQFVVETMESDCKDG